MTVSNFEDFCLVPTPFSDIFEVFEYLDLPV